MVLKFMEDCIHLKACRRVQKIGRSRGHTFPRSCTEDCTAYVSGESGYFLTANEAKDAVCAVFGYSDDVYDNLCESDFPTRSLGNIVDELQGGEE